jgi:hypothetical protein
MEAADILVAPDGTNDEEVNIYQANMWNNATLAALLRNAGVRSRSAGHALKQQEIPRRSTGYLSCSIS